MIRKLILVTLTLAALTLTGCNLTSALGGPSAPTGTLTPTATSIAPTIAALAPALGADPLNTPTSAPAVTLLPTSQGGPTPLPAPTQIGAPTTNPTTQTTPNPAAASGPTATASRNESTTGISLVPAMGEPGDLIMVYGDGFPANRKIPLHWSGPGGALGPVYYEVETDDKGSFEVGLYVPAADKWPDPPPAELEVLVLHALHDIYDYWAGFTYVERFDAVTSLVQTMTSEEFSYSIGLPNGWGWEWDEDEPEYVWFIAPSGVGKGFVRVVETTDVNAAIAAVMAAENLAASSKRTATLGTFPNSTEVTATSGRIVWFISARNRVYALSFVDDSGQLYTIIMNSFKVL